MDLVWCVWLWLIERAHTTGIRSASSASWLGFHLFLTCSFLQRAGGSRWRWRCPAAFWPSDSRASTWPRCGQSCTLIRLGSSLLSFLRSPGLSMFSGPLRPLSPPWLPGWASPGGYICLQQLYSRLFTGNQQGGVLTTTKASPHTCPLYPLRSGCGEKEGGWLWGGAGPSCRVKWGERVLFLCGGLGVGLRGPHGRRAVGFAAAWPPALIWSLSNRGLVKLCRLCSTFTSLDVSLSARPLLDPVWCRIWPVGIRPGWTHSETHSCMIMLKGCDPPQWTACVWCEIRWYRVFSRSRVTENSLSRLSEITRDSVGASSVFRVQIVVNKENNQETETVYDFITCSNKAESDYYYYCLYQIVVFSVKSFLTNLLDIM